MTNVIRAMLHALEGNVWRLLAFNLVAALLLWLFFQAQPVSPDIHNRISGDLRELQALDIELTEAVLQQHYNMMHNYDGLVRTMKRIRELHAALLQAQKMGDMPATPEISRELDAIRQAIGYKSDALEEFKTDNAVSKTSLIYLPVTIDAVMDRVPEQSWARLRSRLRHMMRDTLLLSTGQSDQNNLALAQDIAAIERDIPLVPKDARELAQLSVRHANNFLNNEADVANAIRNLAATSQMHMGAKLELLYMEHYHRQQSAASIYRIFLLLLAVLALAYAVYAYYEMLAKAAELRIAATAFSAQESLVITDSHGVILRVNQAFTDNTGYKSGDVVGKTPRLLSSGRQSHAFYEAMWKNIAQNGSWKGEIWNRRKSGELYPVWLTISAVKHRGVVTHYIGSHVDITERKATEEKIRQLAFHDALTGLPNRQLLLDRLQQGMAASARSGQYGALLFIDLDNFKTLNDTMGHQSGDVLLQQVALRLAACVREGDTVARLGGDEFVVLLEDMGTQTVDAASQAETVGDKILRAMSQPFFLGAREHHCTASIGATLFSEKAQPMGDLLKQADIAMYQAKKAGRDTLRFFDPDMQQAIDQRVSIEHDLSHAVELKQFHLCYQVQVDGKRRPFGAEALIRWTHPERGLVSPAQFIPAAEETGLIQQIGMWVLEEACAQLAAWQDNPLARELVLSVNVSARQFYQANFVTQVKAVVNRHAIDPNLLKLELTEGMLLENVEDTIATMNALREIGINLSLDDFGTGYSSLQYLKRLSLSQLKIDQSFVRDIVVDSSDQSIVKTIIAMAQNLDMGVIAEGVETEQQLDILLSSGCNHFQGYLFSRPVPLDQFEALLCNSHTVAQSGHA